ncbi:hypothetical protein ACFL9T_07780 [Thermodesulfobacteriota bacterium]
METNSIEGFQLYNFPVITSIDVYEEARRLLSEYVSRHQAVVALYEFGSVKSPGISDLDFVVAVQSNPSADLANYLRDNRHPPLVRELMDGGTLMIMRQEDFENILFLDDVDVTLRYGKLIPLEKPTKEIIPFIDLCRLIDWIPERTAQLLNFAVRRKCPVKNTIGILSSLIYSLVKIDNLIGKKDPLHEKFSNAMNGIRAGWFNDPAGFSKKLIELLFVGIKLGFSAISDLARYIRQKSFYGNFQIPERAALRLGERLSFEFQADPEKTSLNKSPKPNSTIILPALIYLHFAVYALIGGPIGYQIMKNITPTPNNLFLASVDETLLRIQQKRMELCNSMAKFLMENRFERGLFKFGWYYPY